jgi:hypothetical protein
VVPVFVAHVGMGVGGLLKANDPDLELTVVELGEDVMDRFPTLGGQITETRVKLPPGAGENLSRHRRQGSSGLSRLA